MHSSTQQKFGDVNPGIEPPAVVAPDPRSAFLARAKRFERLAKDHPLADYLGFMGRVAQAQHELLQAHPDAALPNANTLEQASAHGMPAIPANGWRRDPVWRAHLSALAKKLLPTAPADLHDTLNSLIDAPSNELEAMADAVLRTEYMADEAARAPFIAAALQVYWTWMASRPELAGLQRLDVPGVCPCCGSLPVASIVSAGTYTGTRYLHCSLCSTEWNLVRANCSTCGDTDKVSYRVLERDDKVANETVRAEVCDACMSYLKLVRQDVDATADPVADDLATLALDILVDEAGYARSGPNPLFVPGDPD